ncbi:peptidoglycan-binding protein [Amycolatopsis sp. NPDC051061]|uniref:peptidoglycan-binding protein n=1 Tax=Amycolatopsis sp. NPDC051061 TaxID=3155042 RepID=UPI003424668C
MTSWTTTPRPARRDRELALQLFGTFSGENRATLARAALLRMFDETTYRAVLRAAGAVDLRRLHELGGVELLPGGDGQHRIHSGLRDVAWASWYTGAATRDVPAGLRAFARQIAGHSDVPAADRLRALLLIDEVLAMDALTTEFEACVRRMDLAGCRNLLDALGDPLLRPHVGKRLLARCNELTRVLTARELHRSAFLSAARYLHRPALEAELDRLLGGGPHVLRLVGSGGYGKTTLLRWFISRRCVELGIPCALIDLDVVDSVNAVRYPFLIALEIAHQLNGQLTGAPFEELLREHGSFRRLLIRQAGALGPADTPTLGTETSQVSAEEVRERFLAVFADLSQDEPMVIVVDTLEEAALQQDGDVDELARLLVELRSKDMVRLVLSGRHTRTEEGIRGFRRLAASTPQCQVEAFRSDESRKYLVSTRGIERDDLVSAIVLRVHGVPWQLALYADVVKRYPTITVAALKGLDPGVAWAVDRVVARIRSGVVQWLIRYGSIPRRLSREFAEEVLLPRIIESMAGSDLDHPARDPVPPDAAQVFPTDVFDGDFDAAWNRLVGYAARSSWIWLTPGAPQTVEFEVPLREAMRTLVRAQPIHDVLRRDAIRYYESVAERSADWVTPTIEAMYHRFRLDGIPAAEQWYDAVARAWRDNRPDWVVRLSEDLLGRDYLDDREPVEMRPGLPLVEDELVSAAHAERAWALATIARNRNASGDDLLWSKVERSIAAVANLPVAPGPRLRLTAADAALSIARNRPDAAARLLTEADLRGIGPEEAAILDRLLADALGARGDLDGRRMHLIAALDHAPSLESTAEILEQLAEYELTVGHIDHAEARSEQAIGLHLPVSEAAGLRRLRVRVAMDMGRPATALRLADAGFEQERITALLALSRAPEAVDLCTKAMNEVADRSRHAELLVLRGLASAELFDVDRALDDFLRARSEYTQAVDNERAGMACVRAAELMLRKIGNLREAEHLLDEAMGMPLHRGGDAWGAVMLLHAELDGLRGNRDSAARRASSVLDRLDDTTPPRRFANVVVAALLAAPTLAERWLPALTERLTRITPPSARLAALGALDRAPWTPWGAQLAAVVFEGFDDDVEAQPGEPADQAWLDLRRAHLHRVAGREDRAVRLATAATEILGKDAFLARWRLLELVTQCRQPDRKAAPDPLWETDFALLSAVTKLSHADLMFADTSTHRMRLVLDQAGRALDEGTQRPTRWRWRILELRQRLASREGNAELVEHYRRRAEAALVDIGQREQHRGGDLSPDLHRVRPEVRLNVVLEPAGALVVFADGRELLRLPARHDLVAAVRQEVDRRAKSPLVRWTREATRRSSLLDVRRLLRAGSTTGRFDLRISADPPLAQLPWELLTFSGTHLNELPDLRVMYRSHAALRGDQIRVRVLQEALLEAGAEFAPGPLDGYLGQETQRAVTLLQYRSGLTVDGVAGPKTWKSLRERTIARRAPHVVVLEREPGTEFSSARGYSPVGADDLATVYDQAGWEVQTLRGGDLSMLDIAVPPVPIDILHVNASMDVSGSVPYLDFGSSDLGWSLERSEDVPVTALDHALYQISLRGHTPLVVLDIAASPRVTSETVRQLLLRNDFAHQLLALGKAHSVLVTGLAAGPDAAEAQAQLVTALSRPGGTPADVIEELHAGPGDHLRRTALFTALRPDLMPRISPERQRLR